MSSTLSKLTKEDLFGIKPDTQKAFVLDEPKKVLSAKAYIYNLNAARDLPDGVDRFTYITNTPAGAITVTAVAKVAEPILS